MPCRAWRSRRPRSSAARSSARPPVARSSRSPSPSSGSTRPGSPASATSSSSAVTRSPVTGDAGALVTERLAATEGLDLGSEVSDPRRRRAGQGPRHRDPGGRRTGPGLLRPHHHPADRDGPPAAPGGRGAGVRSRPARHHAGGRRPRDGRRPRSRHGCHRGRARDRAVRALDARRRRGVHAGEHGRHPGADGAAGVDHAVRRRLPRAQRHLDDGRGADPGAGPAARGRRDPGPAGPDRGGPGAAARLGRLAPRGCRRRGAGHAHRRIAGCGRDRHPGRARGHGAGPARGPRRRDPGDPGRRPGACPQGRIREPGHRASRALGRRGRCALADRLAGHRGRRRRRDRDPPAARLRRLADGLGRSRPRSTP